MSSNEQPVFTTEWSQHPVRIPGAISICLHAAALMLAAFPWVHAIKAPRQTVTEVVLYSPAPLMLPQLPDRSRGGGGGGMRAPTPPSLGRLARGADKQLVPPAPETKAIAPELIAEPTIVATQLAYLPQISLLPLGDPDGVPGPPSPGPGAGGGIGPGNGHGVGPGDGPGAGPGKNGGSGGDSGNQSKGNSSSGSLTMPVPVYTPDPNYSEDARKARFQGVVTLQTVVRADGSVDVLSVLRSPGYGLDQEAVKTVKQWRFKPGKRNGQPVDIQLSIEVNFRIL